MPLSLNRLFDKVENSYDIMRRITACEKRGSKSIYISRYDYMSISYFKYILVNLSKQGYSLSEIKYIIKNGDYKDCLENNT